MMDNKLTPLNKIDGIYDIQPPISPGFSTLELSLLTFIAAVTLCALLYVIWIHFYSTKGRAKRNIKKLHVKYLENKINDHDTAYKLIFFLQQGLKLNHIGNRTVLPKSLSAKEKQWQSFICDISILRYKKNINSRPDINALFTNSLLWLKLWP